MYSATKYRNNIIKYKRLYDPTYVIPKGYHVHHIVPKSVGKRMGWSLHEINHPDNLMVVSPEEHKKIHEERGDVSSSNFLSMLEHDVSGNKNYWYGKKGYWYNKKRPDHSEFLKKFHPTKGKGNSSKGKPRIHTRGINNHQFYGYYHTPFGKFTCPQEYTETYISQESIYKWCKNCDIKIHRVSYYKSSFLKSLGSVEEVTNKTFRDIGFWFEHILQTKDKL